MTQLETAMAILMKVFDTYAASQGARDTLTKNEAKTLMEKELPELIKSSENPGEVEAFLKGLDFNGDSEMDFSEFMVLVVTLTCVIHGRCKK